MDCSLILPAKVVKVTYQRVWGCSGHFKVCYIAVKLSWLLMTHSSMHRCNKYLCWHIVQAAIIGLREQHSHNSCCRIDLGFWQQNRFCIICKQLSLWGSPDSQSCAYIYYQWFTVISQGSFFSSSCSLKAHRSAISKQVNSWESEINMIVRFADQNSFIMFSKDCPRIL